MKCIVLDFPKHFDIRIAAQITKKMFLYTLCHSVMLAFFVAWNLDQKYSSFCLLLTSSLFYHLFSFLVTDCTESITDENSIVHYF